MSKRKRDPKVIPLQGVYHRPDGTRALHPPCFERCPPPPKWLSKRAKALWRAVAKDMHHRAILTVLDTSSVAVYCSVVAHAEELDAAGNTAAAAEFWHEADEWAAMLLVDPTSRLEHAAPTTRRSTTKPPQPPDDRPAA